MSSSFWFDFYEPQFTSKNQNLEYFSTSEIEIQSCATYAEAVGPLNLLSLKVRTNIGEIRVIATTPGNLYDSSSDYVT